MPWAVWLSWLPWVPSTWIKDAGPSAWSALPVIPGYPIAIIAGIGERFIIHAEAMRVGAKVGNGTHEVLRGADGKLLSTGTAAYLTS
jgi:hypothetical protein